MDYKADRKAGQGGRAVFSFWFSVFSTAAVQGGRGWVDVGRGMCGKVREWAREYERSGGDWGGRAGCGCLVRGWGGGAGLRGGFGRGLGGVRGDFGRIGGRLGWICGFGGGRRVGVYSRWPVGAG